MNGEPNLMSETTTTQPDHRPLEGTRTRHATSNRPSLARKHKSGPQPTVRLDKGLPIGGTPDCFDGETSPGSSNVTNILPSVVINMGVLGSSFSGLNDSASPFNGMMIYQRRADRRPIVLVQENLLGAGQLRGTVYSKWGHVILAGKGTYDARFVTGTMRIIALLDMQISPATLLPAAQDVYLVE